VQWIYNLVGNPADLTPFQETRREIFSVASSTAIFASQDYDWDADVDGARNRWCPTLTKLPPSQHDNNACVFFLDRDNSTIHPRNGPPAQLEPGAPASHTTNILFLPCNLPARALHLSSTTVLSTQNNLCTPPQRPPRLRF